MHKHKWIYTLKYKSNHFGKHGFKSIAKPYRTINVEDLEVIIRKAGLKANTNGIISLDLSNMGYDKLLGAGTVSVPLMVKVKRISERAREKVEAAGGRIITP